MVYVFGWFIGALIVGFVANALQKSFALAFFGSLILSPFIGLLIVLLSPRDTVKCKYCGFKKKPSNHFCPACDKDKEGKTKEDFKKLADEKLS